MDNISEQIMNVINQIAEKLGVAAEKIYPILIKQAYVEGCSNLFWIIIITILTYLILKYWFRHINFYVGNDNELTPTKWIVALVIIAIGFAFLPSIKDTFTAFLNPDWYIIQMILDKIN